MPFALKANTETHTSGENTEKKDASEEVVEHIMNHVADANEFHIATVGHNHYSLHLPCILLRDGKLSVFSSAVFEGGEKEVDGYKLDEHTGRVVDAATSNRSTNIMSYFTATDSSKFLDFSITKNVFTTLLGFIILTIILLSVKNAYVKNGNKSPKGIQSALEPIIQYLVDDVIKQNIGPKYEKFVPFLLSVFFFILINNLMGLIPFFPGSANLTGNIAVTLTLATITFILTNLNGSKDYWTHVFLMPGIPKPLLLILTPIEIIGLFTKPFALMMRLFANMTAGHIIILSLVSLIFILGENGSSVGGAIGGTAVAVPFVLFMNGLELLVALLQAYIFTLLSAIFIGMATEEHHHAEEVKH